MNLNALDFLIDPPSAQQKIEVSARKKKPGVYMAAIFNHT